MATKHSGGARLTECRSRLTFAAIDPVPASAAGSSALSAAGALSPSQTRLALRNEAGRRFPHCRYGRSGLMAARTQTRSGASTVADAARTPKPPTSSAARCSGAPRGRQTARGSLACAITVRERGVCITAIIWATTDDRCCSHSAGRTIDTSRRLAAFKAGVVFAAVMREHSNSLLQTSANTAVTMNGH